MKPSRFAYEAPSTVEEALALLAEPARDIRVIAGGQSLVPMMNFRIAAPDLLVDLNGIAALRTIERRDGILRIGAMVRQATLEDSPDIRRDCPLLAEALPMIAHRQIRNRGTIGGSIALAYPGAEIPLVACALDARMVLRSASTERQLSAAEFFQGALSTALAPNEILLAVELPVSDASSGTAFVEVARRHGDFALAAAAAVIRLGADGRVAHARLAVSGVTEIPIRCESIERALIGETPRADVLAELSRSVTEGHDMADDGRYPAGYRAHIVRTTARRALERASERAGAIRVH